MYNKWIPTEMHIRNLLGLWVDKATLCLFALCQCELGPQSTLHNLDGHNTLDAHIIMHIIKVKI